MPDHPTPDVPTPADRPADRPAGGPAELHLQPARARWWRRLSPVWLVPLVALVVSLGVAWNSYSARGELISISFDNASGIEAGQTVLKYRDVTVGKVEQVGFDAGLNHVEVMVRVDKDVAPFIDQDAQFWVVRPEVSVRGVTGLNTVLSGAYIAGVWDSKADTAKTEFTGLEQPPLLSGPGAKGVQITLRLEDGNQISAGAPILHRGIEVGSVGAPRLTADGTHVLIDAFVRAPYAARITSSTRFWDASGFDIRLGSGGLELDVKSLASLIEGGISFDTIVSGGDPVNPGQMFDVYPTETAARASVFTSANERGLPLSVVFDGSVAGLSAGADVRFQGLKVGEVTDLGAFVDGEGDNRRVRMLANLKIEIGKLGLPDAATDADALDLLQNFVKEKGLRARLTTSSIITGSLIVELVEMPDAPPAEINLAAKPYPVMPSTAAEVSDFAATSQGVFERINKLPVEELMNSAIDTLDSIRAVAADPGTRRVPGAAADLLEDARKVVNSPDIQATLADLRATAGAARQVVEQVQQGQAVQNLMAAIEKANKALDGISGATDQFPQITTQVREITEKLNSAPIQELATSADSLVKSADALISTEGAKQLPAQLGAALDEMRQVLAEIRQGGAIENANNAISAAEAAANSINQAAQTLPGLSDRLTLLVNNANEAMNAYGDRSRFNTELLSTMRDIQTAASNVASLARMLERKPNSLILGR